MSQPIGQLRIRNKSDLENARAIVEIGYPAVEPLISHLMEWMQDGNWPVAQIVGPFLASIGRHALKDVRHVLNSTDDTWKYFVLCWVVGESPDLASELRAELNQLAHSPTPAERTEELDQIASGILTNLNTQQ